MGTSVPRSGLEPTGRSVATIGYSVAETFPNPPRNAMTDASPPTIDLGEALGWITVVANGAEIRIDMFAAHNRIVDIFREVGDGPISEAHARIAAYLAELGLAGVSHYQADQFATRVSQEAKALAGKSDAAADTTPSSSASTE